MKVQVKDCHIAKSLIFWGMWSTVRVHEYLIYASTIQLQYLDRQSLLFLYNYERFWKHSYSYSWLEIWNSKTEILTSDCLEDKKVAGKNW